jgi:hypothetical protein
VAERRRRPGDTEFPTGAWDLDLGSDFGRAARLVCYAITGTQLYFPATALDLKPSVANRSFRVGTGGQPTGWGGPAVRGSSANAPWSSRTYPAGLIPSLAQSIIIWFQGRSDAWDMSSGSNNRLFDVSSGSSWRLNGTRQSATEVNVRAMSFADSAAPNTLVTIDPRGPLVIGMVHAGAGAMRLFAGSRNDYPRFVGTDTVTVDAAPAGADCRLDFGGSGGTDIDYRGGAWLTGALADDSMCRLMAEPGLMFRPRIQRYFLPAGGGGPATIPFSIAATEAADVAAVTMVTSRPMALAATEAPDVAAVSMALAHTVALAATEGPDVAAMTMVTSRTMALAATEAADTAAMAMTVQHMLTVAATEGPDVAAMAMVRQAMLTMAATEDADVASFAMGVNGANALDIAATEAPDTAAMAMTLQHELALAASEAADVAAVAMAVQHELSLAATEEQDTASIKRWKDEPAVVASVEKRGVDPASKPITDQIAKADTAPETDTPLVHAQAAKAARASIEAAKAVIVKAEQEQEDDDEAALALILAHL